MSNSSKIDNFGRFHMPDRFIINHLNRDLDVNKKKYLLKITGLIVQLWKIPNHRKKSNTTWVDGVFPNMQAQFHMIMSKDKVTIF